MIPYISGSFKNDISQTKELSVLISWHICHSRADDWLLPLCSTLEGRLYLCYNPNGLFEVGTAGGLFCHLLATPLWSKYDNSDHQIFPRQECAQTKQGSWHSWCWHGYFEWLCYYPSRQMPVYTNTFFNILSITSVLSTTNPNQ